MTNREAFATALALLGGVFNGPLPPEAIEGYWLALSGLTEEEFRHALSRALRECKFMPRPAELLAFARPPKNAAVNVIQAWQAVRHAIDEHDYLVGSVDFGPLVNAVIRNLGGWDTLCKATLPELDNPGWLRKHFDEIYTALAAADPSTLHGEALAGALPPKFQGPKHVVVAIGGQPVLPRLEANGTSNARASIAAHVRELAEGKST